MSQKTTLSISIHNFTTHPTSILYFILFFFSISQTLLISFSLPLYHKNPTKGTNHQHNCCLAKQRNEPKLLTPTTTATHKTQQQPTIVTIKQPIKLNNTQTITTQNTNLNPREVEIGVGEGFKCENDALEDEIGIRGREAKERILVEIGVGKGFELV